LVDNLCPDHIYLAYKPQLYFKVKGWSDRD
jgi:hypothetical protein